MGSEGSSGQVNRDHIDAVAPANAKVDVEESRGNGGRMSTSASFRQIRIDPQSNR